MALMYTNQRRKVKERKESASQRVFKYPWWKWNLDTCVLSLTAVKITQLLTV